jgi:hypothetical protein
MTRARTALLLAATLAAAAGPAAAEVLRPAGSHNDAAHRYFPDLEARLNAVRYARWRALELALLSGITPQMDQEYSAYLLGAIADPPRYPPEPELVAPILARDALPIYRALWWGAVFETQVLDALAAADASPATTPERIGKALDAYRRERWALTAPAPPTAPADSAAEAGRLAPASANILVGGAALFVDAAQALAEGSYGEQRQRVRRVVEEFDKSFAREQPATEGSYTASAPAVAAAWPEATASLDGVALFRAEVFEALAPAGTDAGQRAERDARLKALAARWGIAW